MEVVSCWSVSPAPGSQQVINKRGWGWMGRRAWPRPCTDADVMYNVDRPCGFSVVQHACLSAPLPRDSGASQALGTHFLYCGNLDGAK